MDQKNNFWDLKTEKKSKKKLKFNFSRFQKGSFVLYRDTISTFKTFGQNLVRLPKVLTKKDKFALLLLTIILVGLLGFKGYDHFFVRTKIVPNFGGSYKEVLVGEAKYLNPIIAKSESDRTVNKLIYSGLTKIDKNGQIAPDIASSWEISADNKNYNFHLKNNVYWQDGAKFTSADVAYTIEMIKSENLKSPYYDFWKDVTVEAPDELTVIFNLKSPYGPFIYNTVLGLIPEHIGFNSISSSPVGTGPYKFKKAISGDNSKIKEIQLESNKDYYDSRAYIDNVSILIASDETEAKKLFENDAQAISGLEITGKSYVNYSFETSRVLGMIFNLRDEKLKDEALRKKIVGTEKIDPALDLTLTVLDKPIHVAQAESIKKSYADRGININIQKLSAIDFQKVLDKKNFQLILYGFDYGYDRDSYVYWHTSQIATGSNLAGFSNKEADILLEDARTSTDSTVRNQKYDQFFAIIKDRAVAVFYPAQKYNLTVKSKVKGIDNLFGFEPQDHLNYFSEWYIKTKRINP